MVLVFDMFENGERCYDTYKGALLSSIYYDNIAWYKNTILYKGMIPHEYHARYSNTKEFMELPLFNPMFINSGNLKSIDHE